MPADPDRRSGLTDWERAAEDIDRAEWALLRSARRRRRGARAGSGGPPRAVSAARRPPAAAAREHQHTECGQAVPRPPDGLTADALRAALDQARAAVGAAREDTARLALDAERFPLSEGRSLATRPARHRREGGPPMITDEDREAVSGGRDREPRLI